MLKIYWKISIGYDVVKHFSKDLYIANMKVLLKLQAGFFQKDNKHCDGIHHGIFNLIDFCFP
jgi:hypothetical protein